MRVLIHGVCQLLLLRTGSLLGSDVDLVLHIHWRTVLCCTYWQTLCHIVKLRCMPVETAVAELLLSYLLLLLGRRLSYMIMGVFT